jgi:hypothetical protein
MLLSGAQNLEVLNQASRLLAQAKSLDDIKTIRDKAEAARTYVKAAKLGLELHNRAAELKLRAERKAGEVLKTLKLRGGNRRSKFPRVTLKLNLAELGISRKQSMLWQRIASVSDREFVDYMRTADDRDREITSAGLLRRAVNSRDQRRGLPPTAVTPAKPVEFANDPKSDLRELIAELLNHCELLTRVLRPVFDDERHENERAEKRIVNRLLSEIPNLIRQLEDVSLRTFN